MCNEAARRTALGLMREDFSQTRITLTFPEGLPNLGAAPSIRITDSTVIVRAAAGGDGTVEMVQRRWSWVGPSSAQARGKPVYNYRSEGRRFTNAATQGRCLIPLDGFYEFTDDTCYDLLPGATRPPRRRKLQWLFTLDGDAPAAWGGGPDRPAPGLFCVAGLWRSGVEIGSVSTGPATGEAWTMLTCEPGPDIERYHSRQVVLMPRDRWADWLGGVVPAAELIAPTPKGVVTATLVS